MMKQYYTHSWKLSSVSEKHNREQVYMIDEEMLGLAMYKCNLSIFFFFKYQNTSGILVPSSHNSKPTWTSVGGN